MGKKIKAFFFPIWNNFYLLVYLRYYISDVRRMFHYSIRFVPSLTIYHILSQLTPQNFYFFLQFVPQLCNCVSHICFPSHVVYLSVDTRKINNVHQYSPIINYKNHFFYFLPVHILPFSIFILINHHIISI